MKVDQGDTAVLESLHVGLRRYIVEQRWELTEIQRSAIPAILNGQDCVIEAPTAGGKTEAVVWPALTRAASQQVDGVRILYLAPLRALLNNLEDRVEKYSSLCMLEAFKWHGDVSHTEKLARLRRIPHVLLTTPESLEAIILRKAEWRSLFKQLQVVILDEAHNFAAGDRGGHLLSLLARLDAATGKRAQRIALTATIGNPQAMLRWLVPSGSAPARRISAQGKAVPEEYGLQFFDELSDSAETPPEEQAAWQRLEELYRVLSGARRGPQQMAGGDRHRAIAFVRSRRSAENFAKALEAYARHAGVPALRMRTHHSAVSKFFREDAERLIQVTSETGIDAILSTSTLELGIDIGELSSVVQCDSLASSSAFLQRVGRTGRRQGRPRVFHGLCTEVGDLLLLSGTVSLGQRKTSEALVFPTRAFHLLAHQLLCLSLQQHGVTPSYAWEVLRQVHVFSGIDRSEFEALVSHLVSVDFLRDEAGVLVISDEGERRFLGAGWRRLFAVFDSAPIYDVLDGRTQVGTLDAAFVEGLEPPFLFVLGGSLWQATKVDAKARTVAARRSTAGEAPKWKSFGGPDVPFETAQEVGSILHERRQLSFLDAAGRAALKHEQDCVAALPWRPGQLAVFATGSGRVTVWTYAGDRINRTLARYVSASFQCKATADYRAVEVTTSARQADSALDRTVACMQVLQAGRTTQHELVRSLETGLRPWPFSPFARCLPEPLLISALAERLFDARGLLGLLARGEISQIAERGTRAPGEA